MREIPLFGNGKKNIPNSSVIVGYALIDDVDFDVVSAYKWYSKKSNQGGCIAYAGRSILLMHRLILGVPEGVLVDHIDGNVWNNRRENLRGCTHTQNSRNIHVVRGVSPYKGVSWHGPSNKWRAAIRVNKVKFTLAYSNDQEWLAELYDRAALYYFGEFAWINFPEKREKYALFDPNEKYSARKKGRPRTLSRDDRGQ